jgi:hypothetical protein
MSSRIYAAVILWVLLFAICWLVVATTSCATASPLLPDCRELLAASYQAQVARGDIPLRIEQTDIGVVRLSYLNKCNGNYTEYYLILDSRNAGNPDELPVYGSCMINNSNATMYVKKWLTMPTHERPLINGHTSGWLYKVHARSNRLCNLWSHETCA